MLRSIATIGLLCVAHAAWASDQPRYEPPPAWVKPFEIPKPTTAGNGGTTRVLLEDSQEFGSARDVPLSTRYPYFEKMTETIVLPDGGQGFIVEGNEVDRKIGAWEFKRTAKIEGRVFTMEAGTRTVAPEFPAAEAKAVSSDLRQMADLTIYLRAPITAGKSGDTETASTKTPVGCPADLAPIHAGDSKIEAQFAGQGTKP